MIAPLYLILALVTNAIANIMLKLSAGRNFDLSLGFPDIIIKHTNFIIIAGLLFLNLAFYWLALRTMPLSISYTVMSVSSFVLVNGFAFIYLKESLTTAQLIGYIFIICGMLLVLLFKNS